MDGLKLGLHLIAEMIGAVDRHKVCIKYHEIVVRTIFPGGHPNSLLVQTLNFGEHMGISLIFVWIGHTLMYMS